MNLRKYIRKIITETLQHEQEEWMVFESKFYYATTKFPLFIGTKEECEKIIINNPELDFNINKNVRLKKWKKKKKICKMKLKS
jgi:hypothetical protein